MLTSPDTGARADTVRQLLAEATALLTRAGVGTPRLDAEVLLGAASDLNRTALYLRGNDPLPLRCRAAFQALVARRCTREPLQYIVGHEEFWSLDFIVTPDVLIPRPETELLVEEVLRVSNTGTTGTEALERRILDLGTGSGCIAVALARELPGARLWALDISPSALAVAGMNANRHGVAERIRFAASDLFASVAPTRFDVIVSNPPYVSSAELTDAQPELRWEPQCALDGGAGGLEVIGQVLPAARAHLVDGGWLVMEIGADQGPAAEALAHSDGFVSIAVRADHAGHPRVLTAQR